MGTSPEEQPVLRRSLRILAQQTKLLSVESEAQSNSALPVLKGQESPSSKANTGSNSRKRKRLSSPSSPSPEEEGAKKSPVHKPKRRKSDTPIFVTSVIQEGSKGSRGDSFSGKKPVKHKGANTKQNTCSQERETVIVDATKVFRKNRQKNTTQSATEELCVPDPTPSEQLVVGGRKSRAKNKLNQKSKTRGERASTSKGKGKSGWSAANCYSLPSLADFARLNMASPG